jgi:putative IMPACT (imprinted ancient) family translation regulator
VVVTRYFGGTLLGTGGLVRAYSAAVKEGLRNSKVIEKKRGTRLKIRTDYNGIGKIQYLAGENGLPVLGSEYTEVVVMELLVPLNQTDRIKKAVTEATSGRALIQENGEVYYSNIDGTIELFAN